MGPDGSDVFDEGLFIPMARLVDQGTINQLLLDMIKANSRAPISNEGDVYALISCCEVGAARLVEMMDEFGLDRLDGLADYICETSYAATLESIAALPPGTYTNTMVVDGYESEVELRVALREFHRRIPEYRLKPGTVLQYTPGLRSLTTLPIEFTPSG